MTTDALLLLVVLPLWVLTGLATAFVMRRRGHGDYAWGLLGAVFGPLVIAFAVDAARRERQASTQTLQPGVQGGGPVDVLVGLDGSRESEDALAAAVALLDGRIGRLTLATVLDFDAATTGLPREVVDAARSRLEVHGGGTATVPAPGMVLLAGRAAEALPAYAKREHFHLIVVGARGTGGSKAVLGSVAQALARGAGTPVLLGGGTYPPLMANSRRTAWAARPPTRPSTSDHSTA